MKNELDKINDLFRKNFSKYKEEKGVKITSNVDSSVVFVGSAISVFKEKVLNDRIDSVGNIIIQKAIRTRALKRIMIPEVLEWSSYFDALGVITRYENLDIIISDSLKFLRECLETEYSEIVIKISSRDTDMLSVIKKLDLGVSLEIDLLSKENYSHKYGLDLYGIYGRSFNIAMKNKNTNVSDDIGNIIVIESREKNMVLSLLLVEMQF